MYAGRKQHDYVLSDQLTDCLNTTTESGQQTKQKLPNAAFNEKPHKVIQIIKRDAEGNLTLNRKALEEILSEKGVADYRVAVYSVAGPFRSGKSFMLNLLMRFLQKIQSNEWLRMKKEELNKELMWNGGKNRCINEMWMFVESIPTLERYTGKIFIKPKKVTSLSEQQERRKFFPNLMFLVRDWYNPDYEGLEGRRGNVDHALKPMSSKKHFKSVRKCIKKSLEKVKFMLWPYPEMKVKISSADSTFVSLSEIARDFLDEVDSLVRYLFSDNIVVKRVNGNVVTGTDLINFTIAYCEVFKRGNMPEIGTIIENEAKTLEKLKKEMEIYRGLMYEGVLGLKSSLWYHQQDHPRKSKKHAGKETKSEKHREDEKRTQSSRTKKTSCPKLIECYGDFTDKPQKGFSRFYKKCGKDKSNRFVIRERSRIICEEYVDDKLVAPPRHKMNDRDVPRPSSNQTGVTGISQYNRVEQTQASNMGGATGITQINQDNVKKEVHRLATFQNFPQNIRTDVVRLAKAGFFYKGPDDRVQCFACMNVTSAVASSNPFDPEMHRYDCQFRRTGTGYGNISLTNADSGYFSGGSISAGEFLTRESPSIRARPAFQAVQRNDAPQQVPPIPPPVYETPRTPIARELATVVSSAHKNFLLSLNLRRETDRFQTFADWPRTPPRPSPRSMARAGFFYLGNHDRTQCFSCGGVLRHWTGHDDPMAEHVSHFQHCQMAIGREARNIPDTAATTESRDLVNMELTASQVIHLKELFPCEHPVTPKMRSVALRINSFRGWRYTQATPTVIAEAGFFFIGGRDRAKCFYCNGGLQNWHYYDDPWQEHAKWYPTCDYLLQSKGPEYVHSIVAKFPDLNRPTMRAHGQDVPPTQKSNVQSGPDVLPPPPVEVAPMNRQEKEAQLLQAAMQSEIAKTVVGMGFEERIVTNVMKSQIEEHGVAYQTASAILDAVFAYDDDDGSMETSDAELTNGHATAENAMNEVAGPSQAPSNGLSNHVVTSEESDRPQMMNGHHGIQSMSFQQENAMNEVAGPSQAPSNGLSNHIVTSEESDRQQMMNGHHSIQSPMSLQPQVRNEEQVASPTSLPPQLTNGHHRMKENYEDLATRRHNLQKRLTELMDERMCKVCLDLQADVMFIPCNHICCCMECTRPLRKCPICRKKIERAIRVSTS